MTKTKSTKRALLLSALSLLMCVSMLVGSTFAWFTDSATSANNKIAAGTLDVELYKYNGTEYVNISNSSAPVVGSDILWEPNHTQVVYLMIKNNGSLALNYTVGLNVQNVSKDLYEVMQYAITPDAQPSSVTTWDATNAESVVLGTQTVTDAAVVMAPGAEHYFALSIHMDEMAGNKYQGGEVNFDLTVLANQAPVESDSFNNQYDANANVYNVKTTEQAQAALDAAEDGAIINFEAGNYGTLYFRQSDVSEVVRGVAYSPNAYIRTIKNLTINGNGATIAGFATESGQYCNTAHSNSTVYPILNSFIVMENIKIDGFNFDGTADAFNFHGKNAIDGLTISNCEMLYNSAHVNQYMFVYQNADQASVDNVNGETFVVKFANVTIDNCTANYVERFILAFTSENLTVTNNKVAGAGKHFINLQAGSVSGMTDHTGVITITDNTYTNGAERFFRAAYLADAKLVLERNTVNNAFYGETIADSAELDLVKVNVRTGSAFECEDYDNRINTTANNGATFVPTIE